MMILTIFSIYIQLYLQANAVDTENLHILKRTFVELLWESLIHSVILW